MNTIYDQPLSPTRRLVIGGADLDEQIGQGLQAQHVIVDNQTSQYVYVPDAEQYVDPGVKRTLRVKVTDYARARFASPPGIPQPPGVVGQVCVLKFLSDRIDATPDSGMATVVTAQQPQQGAPAIVVAAGASAVINVPVSPAAVGVSLATNNGFQALSCTGHVTGIPYTNLGVMGGGQYLIAPIQASIDTSVDIAVTAQVAQAVTVWPASVLAPLVGFSKQNPGDVLFVAVVGQQSAAPPAQINVILAAGAVATLVGGVANQTIRIYSYEILSDTAGANYASLRDTNHAYFANAYAPAPGRMGGQDAMGPSPLPGGAGVGLEIINGGAGASRFFGGVSYVQQ